MRGEAGGDRDWRESFDIRCQAGGRSCICSRLGHIQCPVDDFLVAGTAADSLHCTLQTGTQSCALGRPHGALAPYNYTCGMPVDICEDYMY